MKRHGIDLVFVVAGVLEEVSFHFIFSNRVIINYYISTSTGAVNEEGTVGMSVRGRPIKPYRFSPNSSYPDLLPREGRLSTSSRNTPTSLSAQKV